LVDLAKKASDSGMRQIFEKQITKKGMSA